MTFVNSFALENLTLISAIHCEFPNNIKVSDMNPSSPLLLVLHCISITISLTVCYHGTGWSESYRAGGSGSSTLLWHDPGGLWSQGDPCGPDQGRHVFGHTRAGETICGHQLEEVRRCCPAQEALCPV